MLMESSRVLSFLPQFTKCIRAGSVITGKPVFGVSKFSTNLSTKTEESNDVQENASNSAGFDTFRFRYPEFLRHPKTVKRSAVKEKLERRDMLRRRNILQIPEFYVGSIMSVTTADKHVPNKMATFVGICIARHNCGLDSTFILRNVIQHQGVEIIYHLYSPLIHNIEVLRLEKRLDEELYYLREAPNEYSTFPFDMLKEFHDPEKPVPVNTIKIPLNPRPWHQRFERMNLKGVILPELSERVKKRALKSQAPWEKYDLMDEYRKLTPEEEQRDIFSEICDELKKLDSKHRSERKGKVYVKTTRQKLF